jgi:hypothetical protein
VQVSDPVGILGARGRGDTVYGAGLDAEAARWRAIRHGLELYASAMFDPRMLIRDDDGTGDGADLAEGSLWAWRLDNAAEQPVRATAVYLDSAREGPPLPSGVASGPTWSEAVKTGLLRCYESIAVQDALESLAPFARVDLEGSKAMLDESALRLAEILQLMDAEVSAYDITGEFGVPVYLLYLGDRPIASAAGWTVAWALRDGLEQVLLAHQAATAGQLDYAPPPAPGLPEHLRGSTCAPGPSQRLDTGELYTALVEGLVRRGIVPVAVPLDHDPALAALLPYAVRVLIVG